MFNSMNNSNNPNPNSNNNNATANNSATSSAPASPLQSNQNGFYRMQEQQDPRLLAMNPLFSPNLHNQIALFPGPIPIHPMNMYAMNHMVPYNMFHAQAAQRSTSFAPQSFVANGTESTVDPQLISSPPPDASWMQRLDNNNPYFQSPPQPPIGFQSPYLDPRALPRATSTFTQAFTSPDTNFDGLGQNAPGPSAPVGRVQVDSKDRSDRSGSNGTSLKSVSLLISHNID